VINKAYISSMHCRLQVVEEDGKGKGSKDDEENENGISLNHHQCEEAGMMVQALSPRVVFPCPPPSLLQNHVASFLPLLLLSHSSPSLHPSLLPPCSFLQTSSLVVCPSA